MSGPLKFWSSVIGAFVALLALLLYLRPAEAPTVAAPASEERAGSQGSPQVREASDPPPEPTQEAAARPGAPDEQASTTLNPIQHEMLTWAADYRTQMALLLPPLGAIEASPSVDRSVCNDLLTATYNAQNQLQGSPDPDIEESLHRALGTFAEAGKFCLQRKAGLRDTHLLLARAGVTLVEKLLEERYSESGVPGLAEPMEGGSEIGRRAVEFTKTLKEDQ